MKNKNDIRFAFEFLSNEILCLFDIIKKEINISTNIEIYNDLQELSLLINVLNEKSFIAQHICEKYFIEETVVKTEDLMNELLDDLKIVSGDNVANRFAADILVVAEESSSKKACDIVDTVFQKCLPIMTKEEIHTLVKNKTESVGKNRIKWCRNYLKDAKYLKDPKIDGSYGQWELTPKGKQWIVSYRKSLKQEEN